MAGALLGEYRHGNHSSIFLSNFYLYLSSCIVLCALTHAIFIRDGNVQKYPKSFQMKALRSAGCATQPLPSMKMVHTLNIETETLSYWLSPTHKYKKRSIGG